jgi:hypothetical protein
LRLDMLARSDRRMSEQTQERLRSIAAEEVPGCSVEFQAEGNLFKVTHNGGVLSKHTPLMKFADFDKLTDNQIRQIVRGVCGLKTELDFEPMAPE